MYRSLSRKVSHIRGLAASLHEAKALHQPLLDDALKIVTRGAEKEDKAA